MIISVLQENLLKGVSTVSKFSDSGRTLPVLANILLEAEGSRLKLAATNLQMSITMWIGAKVDEPGSITLPAKTLGELVNNLSRERVDLTLEQATNTVMVRCGTTKSNIKGLDADEFPPITHGDDVDLSIPARALREMINHVAFAAAKEEVRPILTGVYTLIDGDQVTMAATDGYRLAVRYARLETPFGKKTEVVIPAKTLQEVARIISDDDEEVGISLPSKRDIVTFHLPNIDVSCQVLEGRFPDFKAIIPRGYITSTTMYTDDLLRKCKAAEVFSRDNSNSGRLYVKPPRMAGDAGEVIIAGKSAERGDTDGVIDAHVEGEPLEISFNIKYLIEVLNVVGSERVQFQSNGAENPAVIRIEGREDFLHVIMPMSTR
jgi:DNA polymerase III subunit beta